MRRDKKTHTRLPLDFRAFTNFWQEYGREHVRHDRVLQAGKVTVWNHDEILSWLHIGRVPVHETDVNYMKNQGFRAVLDLCGDNPDEEKMLKAVGIDYMQEFVLDGTSPSIEQFQRMSIWIRNQRARGKKVYVHCHAGAGRAPTSVIGYLINSGVRMADAVSLVLSKRRRTCVSRSQFRGLAQYDGICGTNNTIRDTEGA